MCRDRNENDKLTQQTGIEEVQIQAQLGRNGNRLGIVRMTKIWPYWQMVSRRKDAQNSPRLLDTNGSPWRCLWCDGYHGRKWSRQTEFKSWMRQFAFQIGIISLGKVWIRLFSLAMDSQVDWVFVDFTKAFDSIHRGKMEQILLAYGIPKETVAAITILYRNTKVKVRSPDGDTEYFDIVAGVPQGDTLAPYLFIICLDYVLRTSIDKIKENGFELTKKRSRRYPATTITDADYADDIAILANTPDQAETLLHSLERAAASIGLYVNAHKTEYMCYNQMGDISTLEGTPLKLVDKFTYLGSSVESTEKDIETRLAKAWTAINRLSIIWKSDLTDKMKCSFFQAAVTSILLYGCTTWTLTKRLKKKLDGNYTRMLRAILNKSWWQHPTRHQLYGHLPPITKTIQVRRARYAGHCWRSRDELIRDVLLWTPTHGRAKAGRPARTYIQQLCEDTGCCPEDLPRVMNDREEWRERVRDIRATSAIWWCFGKLKLNSNLLNFA